jgi:hypothetical protein
MIPKKRESSGTPSGVNSRRFYFVRRSLGTLMELRGAFAVLDGNDAFKESKQ